LGGADLISSARAPGVWALATASRFGGAVAGRTGVVFVCAAGPCENKGSKEKLKESTKHEVMLENTQDLRRGARTLRALVAVHPKSLGSRHHQPARRCASTSLFEN